MPPGSTILVPTGELLELRLLWCWLIDALLSPEEIEAKSALRVGGPETLNVYTVG